MTLRNDLTKRAPVPAAQLASHSKTLRYELAMLIHVAQRLSTPRSPNDRYVQNALVESFAVHCRALIFFLFGHLEGICANGKAESFARLRDTDVLAFDFHPDWVHYCPRPTGVMVHAKWQADKHVAHITTDRADVNQPGSAKESVWNVSDATSAVSGAVGRLLDKAPPENFDLGELRLMRSLIAGLCEVALPDRSQSDAGSGSQSTWLQARTDARTSPQQPECNIFGKTE